MDDIPRKLIRRQMHIVTSVDDFALTIMNFDPSFLYDHYEGWSTVAYCELTDGSIANLDIEYDEADDSWKFNINRVEPDTLDLMEAYIYTQPLYNCDWVHIYEEYLAKFEMFCRCGWIYGTECIC